MVRSYRFFETFFKYVIVPVSLGVVAFFVYRKIDGRIVVLERDVKSLDLLERYNALEMRLETNILYNGNINSEFDKRITENKKEIDSLSKEIKTIESPVVTSDFIEEKINSVKSSFVTLDCLEEKLSEVKSSINKTLEESKIYTNSGEETCDEEEDDEDEEAVSSAPAPAFGGGEDKSKDIENGVSTGKNKEDEKEVNITAGEENKLEKDDGEKKDDEDSTKNKEDVEVEEKNIVTEKKNTTENDDEEEFDNEDNNLGKDLNEGLEEYDAYNDDIFFNDTDKKKDAITHQQEQLEKKTGGEYYNNDYNREKEVVNLIQSSEQTKRRLDELERIVSKNEAGYSFFKLEMCFSPSLTHLINYTNHDFFKVLKEVEDKDSKKDSLKIPFSFFLSLPFSRILPMISYHCLFYYNKGNNGSEQNEEMIEKDQLLDKDDNIIGEKEKSYISEPIKTVKKEEKPLDFSIETSPTMFCISLFRIIKKSCFFLDLGLKIDYPAGRDHSTPQKIVHTFWKNFKWKSSCCLFLGFNLGPQILCFFSFSISDRVAYKTKQKLISRDDLKNKFFLKKLADNFRIEIRLFEASI